MKILLPRLRQHLRRRSWLEGAAIVYGALFLVVLLAAYRGQLPLGQLGRIPYYDKLGHVLLYAVATYLGHRVWRRYWCFGYLPAFPMLFGAATLVEELLQGLAPSRTLDPIDLLCSVVGVVGGYGLAEILRQSR